MSFFGANILFENLQNFAFQTGGVSTTMCADFLAHYPTLFNVDREEVGTLFLPSYPILYSYLHCGGKVGATNFPC